jgi:hypothetical protein
MGDKWNNKLFPGLVAGSLTSFLMVQISTAAWLFPSSQLLATKLTYYSLDLSQVYVMQWYASKDGGEISRNAYAISYPLSGIPVDDT